LTSTFPGPGDYEVCLEIVDDFGCDDNVCETIEIFDTPSIDFSINPQIICAGMTVNFENMSTPTPIPSISWDLDGDGTIDANGSSASFVYPTDGVYDAELFISYSDNCMDSLTQTVTVDPPLNALFDIDTLWACSLPFSISIDDMSTGTGTLTYDWTVTDEDGITTPIIPTAGSYTFTDWGEYTLGLTLNNDILNFT